LDKFWTDFGQILAIFGQISTKVDKFCRKVQTKFAKKKPNLEKISGK